MLPCIYKEMFLFTYFFFLFFRSLFLFYFLIVFFSMYLTIYLALLRRHVHAYTHTQVTSRLRSLRAGSFSRPTRGTRTRKRIFAAKIFPSYFSSFFCRHFLSRFYFTAIAKREVWDLLAHDLFFFSFP